MISSGQKLLKARRGSDQNATFKHNRSFKVTHHAEQGAVLVIHLLCCIFHRKLNLNNTWLQLNGNLMRKSEFPQETCAAVNTLNNE